VGSADRTNGNATSLGPRLSHGSPKPGEDADEKTVLTTFPQNAAPVKSSNQVLRLPSKPSAAPKQEATETGIATAAADKQNASSMPEVHTSNAAPDSMSPSAVLARSFESTIRRFEQQSGVENFAAGLTRQHIFPKRKCDDAALEELKRDFKRRVREARSAGDKPAVKSLVLELQRDYGPQICLGRELADGLPFVPTPKKLADVNSFVTAVREKEVSNAVNAIYHKVLEPHILAAKFEL
jgi:hypothetical protein